VILTRFAYRLPRAITGAASHEVVVAEARALGPVSAPEMRVLLVFLAVALAWVFRAPLQQVPGLGGLSDMGIAIAGAVALFVLPAGGPENRGKALLDWSVAGRIPWGVAILFGGGLAIAGALEANGAAEAAGGALSGLGALPVWLIVLVLVGATVFMSELASNVATLTALLPVLSAIVLATGADPLMVGAAATFAASFGFMLPVATAANAIAYATGAPKQAEMLRWGLVLNIAGIVAIAASVAIVAPLVR
jgi:sodium-dependent dicarboxylate transporter 2/3/5